MVRSPSASSVYRAARAAERPSAPPCKSSPRRTRPCTSVTPARSSRALFADVRDFDTSHARSQKVGGANVRQIRHRSNIDEGADVRAVVERGAGCCNCASLRLQQLYAHLGNASRPAACPRCRGGDHPGHGDTPGRPRWGRTSGSATPGAAQGEGTLGHFFGKNRTKTS